MSETRRLARSLVEPEPFAMESRHAPAEAVERLRQAARELAFEADAERVRIGGRNVSLAARWERDGDSTRLVGEMRPAAHYRFQLMAVSIVMFAIGAAAIHAWVADVPGARRYVLAVAFVLSMAFMPILVVGMGSGGESDRARIRKVLRVALQDEEERYPPAKKWDDE